MNSTKVKQELIKELSLEGLDAAKQEELLGRVLEALMKRIFLDTMERLGDSGMEEYETLVEKEGAEEEIARFLEQKIPNYDAFVQNIVTTFKQELKTVTP